MTLTGTMKHVRVLEQAGLVTTEKAGRARRCRAAPRQLDDIEAWIESYRQALGTRLDRFGEVLECQKGELA
jgi:DNA-binding transcriptional ArsR family regulator